MLSILSILSLPHLKFAFSIEQFFPQGDEDLEFYQEFISEFESDNNFLLVAVENKPSVFDTSFLKKFDQFAKSLSSLPYVIQTQSLATFKYPIKTPFGISSISALHIDDPVQLEKDKERILSDERFVYNFINESGTVLVILLKTVDEVPIVNSFEMMDSLSANILSAGLQEKDVKRLGRVYFQSELAKMQKTEVLRSTILGGILVSFILILIFRRLYPILIAVSSIGIGLILFFGLLSLLGRELNAIAAFYPVLMLIVGTSDVIHIMTKYIDELKKGKSREDAISVTIKEIGLATLLTSVTTAVGFLSLLTSRLEPIQSFGINSAMGVVLAFICVIVFTCSVLSLVPKEKLLLNFTSGQKWEKYLMAVNQFTIDGKAKIVWSSLLFLAICIFGMTKISTNYTVENNLPKNSKITNDFLFFEKELSGFRPLEFAVMLKEGKSLDDYEVIKAIAEVDEEIRTYDEIKSVSSIIDIYKSINQMHNSNRQDAYLMPKDEATFIKYRKLKDKLPNQMTATLINEDKDKTRISTRIKDLGADKIKALGEEIDFFIKTKIDPSLLTVRRTGTGLIFDKNAVYIREKLIVWSRTWLVNHQSYNGPAFRNVRMLFISLVPNLIPLIFAAALLGFADIKLEGVISIIFALIFGIAVDDSIHFLSKYNLVYRRTKDKEEALRITFAETGKAICFTTIILFFGFLIMLFSVHPPSVTIGAMISVTLFSALIADLVLLPVLIRKFL